MVVADPWGGDASPHRHMVRLADELLAAPQAGAGKIMIVAHSYVKNRGRGVWGGCGPEWCWFHAACVKMCGLASTRLPHTPHAWARAPCSGRGEAHAPHRHDPIAAVWQRPHCALCTALGLGNARYGAALTMGLVKARPDLQPRVVALALTDGMVWSPVAGWTSAGLLDEQAALDNPFTKGRGFAAPPQGKKSKMLERLKGFAELAPAAFAAPTDADRAFVASVGQNWVASANPAGTREGGDDGDDGEGGGGGAGGGGAAMALVSAGHESHPSTTFAATDDVFAFLDRKAGAGTAPAALEAKRKRDA